jgi:hypothetical protein
MNLKVYTLLLILVSYSHSYTSFTNKNKLLNNYYVHNKIKPIHMIKYMSNPMKLKLNGKIWCHEHEIYQNQINECPT